VDFSNIEQTLFELAQRTTVRGPSRWPGILPSIRRMLSGVTIGAVSLASAFALIGSTQSVALEPTTSNPSTNNHSATVEHQQPAELADSVV
jgi:hypothetical protein